MNKPSEKALLTRVSGPVRRLADRHGGAALLLIKHWGGVKRYVPTVDHLTDDSPLVGLIGRTAAEALAVIVSDMDIQRQIDIPSPRTLEGALKTAILEHRGTTRETARACGCTERYVRLVRAEGLTPIERRERNNPPDPRQTTIFDILRD